MSGRRRRQRRWRRRRSSRLSFVEENDRIAVSFQQKIVLASRLLRLGDWRLDWRLLRRWLSSRQRLLLCFGCWLFLLTNDNRSSCANSSSDYRRLLRRRLRLLRLLLLFSGHCFIVAVFIDAGTCLRSRFIIVIVVIVLL